MSSLTKSIKTVGQTVFSAMVFNYEFRPKPAYISLLISLNRFQLRSVHISGSSFAVDKSSLAVLRKDTGFPLNNCKRALELYDGNLSLAKEWLLKEAEIQGWEKATKLANRPTCQGLIAFHIENGIGSLVEVNCETDFVSKNTDFQSFVSEIVKEFTVTSKLKPSNEIVKQLVNKDALGAIRMRNGRTIIESLAMAVGKFGENVQLARAASITSMPGTDLVGYTHPSSMNNPSQVGRYGVIAIIRNLGENQLLARDLCTHIIGMNPKEIGSMDDITHCSEATLKKEGELTNSEKSPSPLDLERLTETHESEYSEDEMFVGELMEETETVLLKQKFLSDSDVTVGEALREAGMEIVDYIKFQLGGTNSNVDINLY